MFATLFSRRVQAPAPGTPIPAAEAKKLILSGRAPAGLRVSGHLDLSGSRKLVALPAGLAVDSLDLRNCSVLRELPRGLKVRRLNLNGCTSLRELPSGLHCYSLEMRDTAVRSLPPDLRVEYRLDLQGCAALESLPAGLAVGSLILRDCTALTSLPERLQVYFLNISGCTALAEWPASATVRIGHLNAGGCTALTSLPGALSSLARLDLQGCANLSELPHGLKVGAWIDIAGTAITSLPPSLHGVRLRWRGVPIDERIAFHPETITAREILATSNVELRRVLLERMGYDAFLSEAAAQVLDQDVDPGGERRLLKVPLPRDEDLVCLAVYCPSTGRQYILRVPPTTRTCRHAAAWIAGFDDPDEYRPLVET